MGNSSNWLLGTLNNNGFPAEKITKNSLKVTFYNEEIVIYSPVTEEYEITNAVVISAMHEKANIIAYPTWCRATQSGRSFATSNKIRIIPFGALLAEFGIKR